MGTEDRGRGPRRVSGRGPDAPGKTRAGARAGAQNRRSRGHVRRRAVTGRVIAVTRRAALIRVAARAVRAHLPPVVCVGPGRPGPVQPPTRMKPSGDVARRQKLATKARARRPGGTRRASVGWGVPPESPCASGRLLTQAIAWFVRCIARGPAGRRSPAAGAVRGPLPVCSAVVRARGWQRHGPAAGVKVCVL